MLMASQVWPSDLWFLDFGNIQTNKYRMDFNKNKGRKQANSLLAHSQCKDLLLSVSLLIKVNSSNLHCSIRFCFD